MATTLELVTQVTVVVTSRKVTKNPAEELVEVTMNL